MKRMLAVILALAMCLTAFPALPAFAEGEEDEPSEEEIWATSESYRKVLFSDLVSEEKLELPETMPDVSMTYSGKKNGVVVSGTIEQLTSGKIALSDGFDFDRNEVGRITVDGLSDRTFKLKVNVYLDGDEEPAANIPLNKQMGKAGWTKEGDVTSIVLDKNITGTHSVSLGFEITGLGAEETAELLLRSIEFAESSIPVMYFDLDETEGTIEAMNNSEDKSAECYGKASIFIPSYYRNRSEHAEELTDMLDMELEYVRGRGNSTWSADKKPYKVRFAEDQDILGMGANAHWVLLANRYDNSLVRNRMTYWMTGKNGLDLHYSPQCTPVEVVMNGHYYGSYLLTEQIRRGKNRVDIKKLDESVSDPASEKITGGYLLNMYADEEGDSWFGTTHGMYFGFEHPDFDDYSETKEAALAKKNQIQYISGYIQKVEDAIYGNDFRNEDGDSYNDLMDADSSIDFWWIQEFSVNGDAYGGGSNYLYKDRNGKLFWGPLWDFDFVAWGDLQYDDETSTGLDNTGCAWTTKLLTDPEYLRKTKARWPDIKHQIEEVIKEGGVLDRYYEETRISQQYENGKWGWFGEEDYDNSDDPDDPDEPDDSGIPEIRTYKFEIEQLRGWIQRRLDWVDDNIEDFAAKLYTVNFVIDGETVETRSYAANEPYGTLPEAPEKDGMAFAGWYDESGYKISATESVPESQTITAKYVKISDLDPDSRIYFKDYEPFVWYDKEDVFNLYMPDYTIMPVDALTGDITWTSSDEEVATVDADGAVTCHKPGTAEITATLTGGNSNSYTITFGTGDDEIYDIEETAVDRESVSISAGSYTGLRMSAYPSPHYEADYTWISADPDIADVDEYGVVTGNRPGKTVIIIIERDSHLVAKCHVTVTPTKEQMAKAAKTKVKAKAAGGRKVKLTWKKVKGAGKYYVYSASKKNGKYRRIKTVKKTSVVLKKQKKGRTMFYKVRPVTKVGKKSITGKWSNAAKAKVR